MLDDDEVGIVIGPERRYCSMFGCVNLVAPSVVRNRGSHCGKHRQSVEKGRATRNRYNKTPIGKAYRTRERKSRIARGALSPGERPAIYSVLSPGEWVALWRASGGLCPVCQTPLRNRYGDENADGRLAMTDHSHKVEKALLNHGLSILDAIRGSIRGIMCGFCNHKVLTVLHDDAGKAERAAWYLRHALARAQEILNAPTPLL